MLQQPEPGRCTCWRRTRRTPFKNSAKWRFHQQAGLDWREFVKFDARYERPAEVDLLIGDPAKAKAKLGWEPNTKFKALIELMVDANLALLEGKPLHLVDA